MATLNLVEPAAPNRMLHVLVIDDSDADSALARAYLERALGPCKVSGASTLADGAAVLCREDVACVLLDLSLPDSAGINGVVSLRALSSAVPIVVLTGQADNAVGERAVRAGAQDFVIKSEMTPSGLSRAVRHAVERQRQQLALLEIQAALAAEITARERAELKERLAHRRAAALVEHSSDGIVVIDADGTVRSANAATEELLGWPRARWLGGSALELVHPDDQARAIEALEGTASRQGVAPPLELRLRRAAGDFITVELVGNNKLDDPAVGGVILSIRDVSDRKRAEAELLHRTLHDPLTGLGNRLLLKNHLEQALHRRDRRGTCMAVLFGDVDRFKEINDAWGHEVGDRVLVEVASRIQAAVRPSDTVTRLGGDEFVIVAEDLKDAAQAERIAESVRSSVARPVQVGQQEVVPAVSIGIAVASTTATSDALLRQADAAMYDAKATARRRTVDANTDDERRATPPR